MAAMAPCDVAFVGDVALDEYYSAPRFPSLKEKVIVHALEPQMGGMIANAACVFASFGAPARFLTALRPSETSRRLCEGLGEAGLDTSLMVWDESLPESKTIVILAEGEHTVFIPTMGIERIELPPATLDELRRARRLYTNFWEAAPLACGDLRGADLWRDLRSHGCEIWCDLDVAELGEGHDELLGCMDVCFVNEAGRSSLEAHFGADPVAALHDLGTRLVVVTLAGDGADVFERGAEPLHVPGIPVDVVDVTGAGDTFCSAFLYASLKSDDAGACARFANAAAARAVTGMGPRSGAAGVAAVLDFMAERGLDADGLQVLAEEG